MEAPKGFLSRSEVRELDRRAIEEFGVPGVVLMENAGRGAAELLLNLGIHGRVLICCGKGNNGGDGFVIARHLANRGANVQALLCAPREELTGDALINFTILERGQYPLLFLPSSLGGLQEELARSEWVVDALFGTGLSGPVRPPFDRTIEAINARPNHVLAVDIPSGLDCDSGQPLGATIRAEQTATFVAPKRGFAHPAAAAHTGLVHVVDIGLPRILLEGLS
ncbi:MAG TPA: NAD(P)H-hydrate epimerase [Gemmataceae bacterium]|nr:NAD(P)H-hydrate epimerase [Gemmataceae bacterium]